MFDKKLDANSVAALADAIRNLPVQKPPSAGRYEGLLDGLECVVNRTRVLLQQEPETKQS